MDSDTDALLELGFWEATGNRHCRSPPGVSGSAFLAPLFTHMGVSLSIKGCEGTDVVAWLSFLL